MAGLFDQFTSSLGNLLNSFNKGIGNAAKTASSSPVAKAANLAFNPVAPFTAASNQYNIAKQDVSKGLVPRQVSAPLVNLNKFLTTNPVASQFNKGGQFLQSYSKESVYKPLTQGISDIKQGTANRNYMQAGLGAGGIFQAGFNTLRAPVTMGVGALSGGAEAFRTGKPVASGLVKGAETGKLPSEGLGVTNPVGAFVVNAVALNPRSSLGNLKNIATNPSKLGKVGDTARLLTGFKQSEGPALKADLFAGKRAAGFNTAQGKFASLADMQTRFEINDRMSSVNTKAVKNAPKIFGDNRVSSLGEVFNHPELYKNYPEFKNIRVIFTQMGKDQYGSFDSRNNIMFLNKNYTAPKTIKETIVHELQHAIQEKEGFAKGASAQLAGKNFEAYSNSAGEVEARAAGNRRFMTTEERLRNDPLAGENVRLGQMRTNFTSPGAALVKPGEENLPLPNAKGPSIEEPQIGRQFQKENAGPYNLNPNNLRDAGTNPSLAPLQAETDRLGRKLSASADSATSREGSTPQKLTQPILPGEEPNAPGMLSSNGSIPPGGNAVQKVTAALQKAKPVRGQQEKLYAQERAKRAGAVAGIGQNVPGEKGYYSQLGALKGPLPKAEFESIRKEIQQPEIDELFNNVEKTNLPPFEKITAKTALAKILGAEGGSVPTKGEISLLEEVFGPDMVKAVLDKRPFLEKMWGNVEGALNLPRAIMSTLDLSAPLRQGILLTSRPKQWGPAFASMFKYAASEKSYQGLLDDIKSRPTYQAMREAKLALTDVGSSQLSKQEEAFMSSFVEKIPGFGQLARGSNRAYSGFLNKLRADTFDDIYKNAQKLGLAQDNPKLVDDIAKFVNTATGRGNLGSLSNAGPVLNGLFFSPRLLASRLNTLNPAYYVGLDPLVRKEALKSLLGFGALAGTVLGLAKLSGAEVGVDPRSSDFGKIKTGNTRFDILGGFQQYIRLGAQLATGQKINSQTGQLQTLGDGITAPTRKDILLQFFESKEAPVASFISQFLEGKDGSGQPFNAPAELVNRFIPMIAQDLYELSQDEKSAGVAAAIPGLLGVGTQTYGKQIPNYETTPAGKTTVKLRSAPSLGETIVNTVTGKEASNVPVGMREGLVTAKQGQKQAQAQQSDEAAQVDAQVERLRSLPADQAKQELLKLASQDEERTKKVISALKEKAKNLTQDDQAVRSLGVKDGSRASFIYGQLQQKQTNEEKKAYLLDLAKKGILTEEVLKQIVEQKGGQ